MSAPNVAVVVVPDATMERDEDFRGKICECAPVSPTKNGSNTSSWQMIGAEGMATAPTSLGSSPEKGSGAPLELSASAFAKTSVEGADALRAALQERERECARLCELRQQQQASERSPEQRAADEKAIEEVNKKMQELRAVLEGEASEEVSTRVTAEVASQTTPAPPQAPAAAEPGAGKAEGQERDGELKALRQRVATLERALERADALRTADAMEAAAGGGDARAIESLGREVSNLRRGAPSPAPPASLCAASGEAARGAELGEAGRFRTAALEHIQGLERQLAALGPQAQTARMAQEVYQQYQRALAALRAQARLAPPPRRPAPPRPARAR
eukprot:tig00001669_g9556.t1